jgi:hypothetical protein
LYLNVVPFFEDAAAWETWLESENTSTEGIWPKISKKGSGIASVTYDEALDVALCFGWIDRHKKNHDEHHFLQQFTPSLWSKRNVEKVALLVAAQEEYRQVRGVACGREDAVSKSRSHWIRGVDLSQGLFFLAGVVPCRTSRGFCLHY